MTKTTNLLDPIQTVDPNFQRDYCCALCGSHLLMVPIMMSYAYSPSCPTHGTMYAHTVTSKMTWERLNANISAAQIELNQENRPERSEREILADLGY